MTIALKIGDEDSQVKGFIYFDAVTVYTKTLGGKVTSFPVDSGVNISDHFIVNNPKFTIEGVISGADISGISDKVQINGEKPMNARPLPKTPLIEDEGTGLLKFLPSALKQFVSSSDTKVSTFATMNTSAPAVEGFLDSLMSGTYYNAADKRWRNKMTITTLYEMYGQNFSNAHTDLVITDVSRSETVENGEALFLSITLEKVRRVVLEKTEMTKKANKAVKKKVASKQDQGKQACPDGKGAVGEKGTDPNAPGKSNFSNAALGKGVTAVSEFKKAGNIAAGVLK